MQGVSAQDSLYQAKFQKNLDALSELYCWDDIDFFQGEFTNDTKIDFEGSIRKLSVFNELQPAATGYSKMYNELSSGEKDRLIRYFAFHESYFEAELKEAKLPADLKYLAPALSAMNPMAIDANKRAGVWLLNHFQGVMNGLEINKLVDQRHDVQKATRAFISQLKNNSAQFESVEMTVLACIYGNAKIKNLVARCGHDAGYAALLEYLPTEINSIIAHFQALSVFFKQNKFVPKSPMASYDTVSINRQVHFRQIADVLAIPLGQLYFLNPQFRHSIVPGNLSVQQFVLPEGKHEEFMFKSDSVFYVSDSSLFEVIAQKIEYAPAPNRQYLGEKVKDLEIEGKTKIKYTIQSGDVLGFIAEDYDVRVADLKYWNNIYNERKIQAGKTLDIFVDDENVAYYKKLQPKQEKITKKAQPISVPPNARKVEHTVKSGESPYHIAKKYKGVTPEAILGWNGISDARKIQIGQKLIIYLAQ